MRRRQGDIDREVDEEIRFHIEMRTAANVAAGMEPRTAQRDAELRFGDKVRVREAGRDNLGGSKPGVARRRAGGLDLLLQDLSIGLRSLTRSRLTTAAAVISLALGIGANSANFSVVYGLLFRQLPFEHADRLLFVDAWNPDRGDGDRPLTWADVAALRNMDAFDAAGGFIDRSFTVTAGDTPERVAGAAVTPELFDILGVAPRHGRTFRPGEGAEPGFEQVAIISDALWQRLYGGARDAVGRTLHLNGRELVIVGIMPPGFRFPETEDLWLPLGSNDPNDHERRALIGIARLAPGAGLAAARAEVAAWTSQAQREFPRSHAGWDTRVQWFRHGFVDQQARQSMYLLLAAVGFVLLLACANVANLLLARSTDQVRDMVVRSALGASRARLARQVLTESVLLGLAGGVLGIAVAWAWVGLMARSVPEEMAYWISIRLDTPVLLYTLAISLGTGILFGLLPALQASRAGAEGLQAGGRAVLGGKGRWRGTLVTAEVALSVLLLASATLMMRSFLELQAADPGFEEERLLSLRIVQAGDHYDDPAARFDYFRRVGRQLGALPGVERAVATSAIPADDGGSPVAVLPDGAAEDEELFATALISLDGLFETLGIAPLAGRTFTEAEAGNAGSEVVVLGASLAERLWPGADAVGRNVVLPEVGTFRVIGVVSDLQYEEFGEDGPSTQLQLHFPYALSPSRSMSILVRTAGDPASITGSVRRELAGIDATLAPFDILTMSERRAFTTWPQRLIGGSFAAFGVIAVVLALCGIYGVIAYSVVQRTREIGVRIALGAQPLQLLARVVGGAMRLAGAGALLGLLAALAFARALEGVLYGVSVNDPAPYAAVVALMLLAAAVAAWLPARRAARVDPTVALRAD
jgi:predicted permease